MNDDKGLRGFAAMSAQRRREIAAMGGRAVPKYKRTFRQNRELAKTAGRKGGQNTPPEKRSFSCDRALARAAGCIGGKGTSSKKRAFARSKRLAKRAGAMGRASRACKNHSVAHSSGDQPLVRDPPLEPLGNDVRTESPAGSKG